MLFGVSAAGAETVTVEDAYVRHLPPGQTVTGAFMVLKNGSGQDRTAVSASSDVAEAVELHTHLHEDGVMKMRQVEKIEVPAGSETLLQPGGFHLMLIGLKQPLDLGQLVDITLNFDDGSSVPVKAEVRSVLKGMNMGRTPSEHAGQGMEHAGKKMTE